MRTISLAMNILLFLSNSIFADIDNLYPTTLGNRGPIGVGTGKLTTVGQVFRLAKGDETVLDSLQFLMEKNSTSDPLHFRVYVYRWEGMGGVQTCKYRIMGQALFRSDVIYYPEYATIHNYPVTVRTGGLHLNPEVDYIWFVSFSEEYYGTQNTYLSLKSDFQYGGGFYCSNGTAFIALSTVPWSGSSTPLAFRLYLSYAPPVADAGLDKSISLNSSVLLSGSRSYDPSGLLPLQYNWSLIDKPEESQTVLINATSEFPSLVPDKLGNYVAELTVANNTNSQSQPAYGYFRASEILQLDESLIAHYAFDRDMDDKTGNTGPAQPYFFMQLYPNGISLSEDRFQNEYHALRLNAYQYAKVPHTPSLNAENAMTLAAWIQVHPSAGTNMRVILSKWNPNFNQTSYIFSLSDPAQQLQIYLRRPDNSFLTVNGKASIMPSTWTHVAAAYTPEELVFYINGKRDTTITSPGNISPSTANVLLGASYGAMPKGGTNPEVYIGGYFMGKLDDVYFFNRCLSGNEIRELVNIHNRPPVASVCCNQTVRPGTPVTLDGSGSYDSDGNYPLSFSWSVASKPQLSQSSISQENTPSASFIPDMPGDYLLRLSVADCFGSRSKSSYVTISTVNTPPVADAGKDTVISVVGTQVCLDGSKSWDDDDDLMSFSWSIIEKPAASNAQLSDPSVASPCFVADFNGTYKAALMVSDINNTSSSDTVIVSFDNVCPVANAGGNIAAIIGDTIYLDGSQSYDANNDHLSYRWAFGSQPTQSSAMIFNADSSKCWFVLDVSGEYIVNLIVNDGMLNSNPSSVCIYGISRHDTIVVNLRKLSGEIHSLPESAFKNSQNKKALSNKINAVIRDLDGGLYSEAREKIVNDVYAKTDGCGSLGTADKNDWIINCESQVSIYTLIQETLSIFP
jgi:hypothetical protein